MLAITSGTYRHLDKVFTGSVQECYNILDEWQRIFSPFPRADVVVLTRGNNRIAYYRPAGGRYLNEKLYMIHYNNDGTASLYC